MDKLVRDKIPEIMKKNKAEPNIKIAKCDKEYLSALNKKLLEEVNEFIEVSNNSEAELIKKEIADILEVIEAICKLKNYKMDTIYEIKSNKKKERGGFDKRIILEL